MPYQLKEGKDPLNIAEQEYASGKKLKFTKFTSCIGVVAKKGPTLTAVHLVMVAKDESVFDPNDAVKVLELLPPAPDAVAIVGCIDLWEYRPNGVLPAFQKLTGKFQTLKKYQRYAFDTGTPSASINDNDDIKISY
jgi:hypothetical protein